MTEKIIITKQEFEDIKKVQGMARGLVFQTDCNIVKVQYGEKGLKKLLAAGKNSEHPIYYEKIKTMEWYPTWQRVESLIIISKLFNLSEKEIRDFGALAPRVSFFVKFFLKHFISLNDFAKQSGLFWKKHYTSGEMVPISTNPKDNSAELHLKNIYLPKIFVIYLNGYIESVFKFLHPKMTLSFTPQKDKNNQEYWSLKFSS
jgi:hypothetical protein